MKIAVTSQNFRTVTGHAGKARRFLVFEADGGEVREVERLDLPKEMSFHELQGDAPHPVDGVDVLVTGGCGQGFVTRLARRGIRVVATGEADPAVAVLLVSTGRPLPPPEPHEHHGVVLDEGP
jgi:predicted Fe-Mo cluster-binding NifX family protein